jgi:type II secretory pathway predicted ATPase ExeA
MIDRLQSHYGFTKMPFGRDLAPGMLHRHQAHAEALARITWCVEQRALGVITGEVGAGKTVAIRAALAALDPVRHTIIYLGNPTICGRGMHHAIVSALGGVPRTHMAILIPQAAEALAIEQAERGRTPVLVIDLCRAHNYADMVGPAGPVLPTKGGLRDEVGLTAVGIVTGLRGMRGCCLRAGSGRAEPSWGLSSRARVL